MFLFPFKDLYGDAEEEAAEQIRKDREEDWNFRFRTYMAKRYLFIYNIFRISVNFISSYACSMNSTINYIYSVQMFNKSIQLIIAFHFFSLFGNISKQDTIVYH